MTRRRELPANKVDRLTRAAHALVYDAIDIRTSMPPRWQFRKRRAAMRAYKAKMDEARTLTEQAKHG